MKVSVFLVLVCTLQLSASVMLGQQVSLQSGEMTVREVFKELKTQTGTYFMFSEREVDADAIVKADFSDVSLEEALDDICEQTSLQYEIVDDYVLITKKTPVVEQPVQQEKKTIKGKVADDQGVPLPGVSVVIKGTNVGVATDIDGNYSLEIEDDNIVLVFSFVGMISQEIAYTGQSIQNVTLLADAEVMAEVVVTGYQTISKERATGSFVKIDSEQLDKKSSQNVLERLDGLASGLNFNNGKAEIRGSSSMLINSEPLYVVDGFPIEGGFETGESPLEALNPEDVESITVLKDASAASIWGAKAANGVVVITTKKGKSKGKLDVNFSTYVSIIEKQDLSEFDLMSTSEQIDHELERIEKGWNNYTSLLNSGEPLSLIDEAQVYYQGLSPDGNIWSKAKYDAYIEELRAKDLKKQYEKYFLRNPLETTFNLSLSGNGEKNNFYASLSYNYNKEGSIDSSNDRYVFNIKDTYRISKKVAIKAGLNATLRNQTNNGASAYNFKDYRGYEEIVDENGQSIQYYKRWNPWVSREKEQADGYFSYSTSLLDEARASDNEVQSIDLRANFGLDWNVLENLVFSTSFQYQMGKYDKDNFYSMDMPSTRILVNDFYVDGNYQIPIGSKYDYERRDYEAWDFRNTITWDKDWDVHKLTVFGGTDIRKSISSEFGDTKYGYDKEASTHVPVNNADLESGIRNWDGYYKSFSMYDFSDEDRREFSVFSNIGYEYDGRFSVNGSFRIDQMNLFGSDPDYRYKPLWSVGLGWNLSNEKFMENVEFVNRLKLRATYGIGGNGSNRYSPYAQARAATNSYTLKRYEFYSLTNPANDKLRWEQTAVTNVAVDFALFNNRLSGSIEGYFKKGTDLLGSRPLDMTNGFDDAIVNYASMKNRGFELTLNGSIIDKGDFNWNATLNFSYNKNEVSDIEEGNNSVSNYIYLGGLEVGRPLNNIYSYNYAGLDSGGNVLLRNTDGTTKSWRDGVEEIDELVYHGTTVAPYYGGLTNTFKYKAFDLTVNVTYKFGHVAQFDPQTGFEAVWYPLHKVWANRWQKSGDELKTRVPRLHYDGINPSTGEFESKYDNSNWSGADHYYKYSQDNVYDASYIRVRDITFGYTMPGNYLENTFIKHCRVSAQVKNPFLWVANDKGLDPENRYNVFGNAKAFTLGLKLTF